MRNMPTYGAEIIRVTVEEGHSEEYIAFEANLTRLLNKLYPYYHCGADIYESLSDSNTFFIIAVYNTSISSANELKSDLEDFVKSQYQLLFPYVVSRAITTDQEDNKLMDHCFYKMR